MQWVLQDVLSEDIVSKYVFDKLVANVKKLRYYKWVFKLWRKRSVICDVKYLYMYTMYTNMGPMKFQPYRFVGWFLFADCSPAIWGRQWGYPCRWLEKYEWRLVPHWSFKELGNISPKWSTFLVRCKNRSAIPHLERRIVRLIFPGFRKCWMRRLDEHEKPQLRWFLSLPICIQSNTILK